MGNAESHHDGPAHSEKQRIGGQMLTTPVTYTGSQHVTQNEQIVPADNGKQESDDVMICTGNGFENGNGHLHNGNASDTMSIDSLAQAEMFIQDCGQDDGVVIRNSNNSHNTHDPDSDNMRSAAPSPPRSEELEDIDTPTYDKDEEELMSAIENDCNT